MLNFIDRTHVKSTFHGILGFLDFFSHRDLIEVIIRTDGRKAFFAQPDRRKKVVVFGNGNLHSNDDFEYVKIADPDLFSRHLVLVRDRTGGWKIKSLQGEFGCGAQYSPDWLNSELPIKDGTIIRMGNTSILINVLHERTQKPS